MPRQYRVPGGPFVNETGTRQYRLPGSGFVNETQAAGSVGTAAGTSTATGVGVTALVTSGTAAGTSTAIGYPPSSSSFGTATGTSTASGDSAVIAQSFGTAAGTSTASGVAGTATQHSGVNSYRIPGHGTLNETTTRQYRIPGGPFVNETQITGYSGLATGTSTATGVGRALIVTTGLSSGTSTATGYGTALASATGTAAGTSTATGEGYATLSRPVTYFCPVDYFNYICLDRRADTPISFGTAAGTSDANGVVSVLASSSGTAAGTSTALGIVSDSIVSGYGTAAGTSTATGYGTSLATFVTQRAPTANDDSAHGYAVGHLWSFNGQQWENTNPAPGAAVWTLLPAVSVYVGDAVSGGLCGYGSVKQLSTYAGPAYKIKRASDGTSQDFGFVSKVTDWGNTIEVVDGDAVDAFLLGTTGTFDVEYDHFPGAYHLIPDLTSPTTSATTVYTATINGLRTVVFNSPQNRRMVNTAVPITNCRNVTAVMAARVYWANASATFFDMGNPTSRQPISVLNNNGFYGTAPMSSPAVMTVTTNGASGRDWWQNDVTGHFSTPAFNGPATGLTLGNTTGGAGPMGMDLLGVTFYDSTLSAANLKLARQSALAYSGIQPQIRDTVIFHGDSLTQGNSIPSGTNNQIIWARKVQSQITRPFNYYNFGRGGMTAATAAADIATVSALFTKATGSFFAVVVGFGSNDGAATTSPTAPDATYANVNTVGTGWRGRGADVLFNRDVLPRNGSFGGGQTAAGFESFRAAVNGRFATGAGVDYDVLISVGTHPILGVPATYLTATYTQDNIHENALAGTVDADFTAPIIEANV